MSNRCRAALAGVALSLLAANAVAEPAILTVSGAIDASNRGPSDAEDATILGAQDIAFDKGFAFDRDDLALLDQVAIDSTAPGTDRPAVFSGPLLTDVLAIAGAEGTDVVLQGLDGYAPAVEIAFLEEHDPILAIDAVGASFAIGDLGPTMLVFPPTEDAELAEEFAILEVWGLYHISVE